jgi:hypothetical protein
MQGIIVCGLYRRTRMGPKCKPVGMVQNEILWPWEGQPLQTGRDYEQNCGSNVNGMGTVTANRAVLTHGKRGKR